MQFHPTIRNACPASDLCDLWVLRGDVRFQKTGACKNRQIVFIPRSAASF